MSLVHWRLRNSALLLTAVVVSAMALSADAADRFWPPIVDPPTGEFHPGRWVWGDLVTSDVGTAAKFYGDVFGWTFETYGGEDDHDTYTLVLAGGLPIGGMVFDTRPDRGKQPGARWIGFMSVPDVAAAAAAVEKGGGKVVLKPTVLGERGETAVFQDPEGAVFGAVRSKSGDPLDYRGDINEWVWLDLWTGDVARAAEFYRTVGGYEVLPLEGDAARSGAHLVSGGHVRAGIMQKQNPRTTTVWLPYVRVADARAVAEKARAAGGKVVLEPTSLQQAIVAIIADPTGAPVGVAQLTGQGS